MKLRLRFFGHLSEAISNEVLDLDCEEASNVAALCAEVAERHPEQAQRLRRCMIAVNAEFATPDQILSEGDEVAFLPPVSGG